MDRLHRSEKAVDTQICCDALQLVARGKLDRLFLYTNDSDFIPLCQVLRSLGVNIVLFRVLEKYRELPQINNDLAKECDGLVVMDDGTLNTCYGLAVGAK